MVGNKRTLGRSHQVQQFIDARDECNKRGYHQVSREKTREEPMICYDCDLWFTKKDAEYFDLKYRVKPH